MGNTPTKKEEERSPEKEEDKEKQRKASVVIMSWSNEERNKRFSEIKVKEDEIIVSTILNVKIQEIEQKKDEDSESSTKRILNAPGETPLKSVRFKYNTPGLEETACIHSIVDSTDDEKTVDYITLSLEVEIAKNLVIYTFHQYNGREWTKTEIEQEVGRSIVNVDVYEAFTIKTMFFTMRYMREDIIVPTDGFEYKSNFSTHQRITFPEGAVQGNTKIAISALSLGVESKRNRLEENMDAEQIKISSLSDIVYVHHSQPFKKKVKLRLKLDLLFEDDGSHETCVFHCGDDGSLQMLNDKDITRVTEEEVGDDLIYEVEVDTFSGCGIVRSERGENPAAMIRKINDMGPDHCRILVFLLKGENGKTHLWSDIISEGKFKKREEKLRRRDDISYLKNTLSPTVSVVNFNRIRITVLKTGRVKPASEVPVNSMFMCYDRNAAETYNHFPIVNDMGIKCETGIIQYEIDNSPKRLLHTAYFNSELYMHQRPKTAKTLVKRPERLECQKNRLPDSLSQQPGCKKNSLPDR